MKKSSLTTAVLAGLAGLVGFAGSSQAVEVNPDGTGQVLIYPYYTARANQQTYISVVNSTDTPQAVKVRFLEGYASKEVLDFNLFLSAYDVWTGTVFKLSDAGLSGDGAAVGTRDSSCTVPSFATLPTVAGGLHYQAFSNAFYASTNYQKDKGPQGTDRTNEGYVELIAMADIGDANGTATAITHVPDTNGSGLPVAGTGVPPGCLDGSGKTNPLLNDLSNADLTTDAPSGGLFGSGSIIDVAGGTFYPYNADAIDGFTVTNQMTTSGSLSPNLGFANTELNGDAIAHVFQSGTAINATFTAGSTIDAVSAVFDASALLNEWVANAANGQGTDWVVTFPTKSAYVNTGAAALPPFAELLDENYDGASCVAVGLQQFDREEGSPGVEQQGPVFSPAPVIETVVPSLCHEVNVISISDSNDPVSILGSQYTNSAGGSGLALNVNPFGTAGWLRLDFVNNAAAEVHQLTSADQVTFNGLPATGFAAQRYTNSNAQPGMLANYAGAFRHRVERNISAAN